MTQGEFAYLGFVVLGLGWFFFFRLKPGACKECRGLGYHQPLTSDDSGASCLSCEGTGKRATDTTNPKSEVQEP